jgi:hypothetical protein
MNYTLKRRRNGSFGRKSKKGAGTRFELTGLFCRHCPECLRAGFAGADFAQVSEAEDSGRVAIRKFDLDRVIPNGSSRFGRHPRFEHRQRRCAGPCCPLGFFLAFVVAHGAGARITEIVETVVALVSVSPTNVDPFSCRQMNLQAGRLFSRIERDRHQDATENQRPRRLLYCATVGECSFLRAQARARPILCSESRDSAPKPDAHARNRCAGLRAPQLLARE